MSLLRLVRNVSLFVGLLALWPMCKLASYEEVKQVRFLHLADTHAQLETHWEYLPEDPSRLHSIGGYARIRTALDERRKAARGAVFTIDGGDTVQGSALAAWTQGEAVVAPFNALHVDVGTPGNWEVVYGPAAFRKLMAELSEKVICYNFHEKSSGKRLFPPSAILEKDGVRVAFVGVTAPVQPRGRLRRKRRALIPPVWRDCTNMFRISRSPQNLT